MISIRDLIPIEKIAASDLAARIRLAASKVEEPKSLAQAEAGNYQMGHLTYRGLPVTIETAKGQTRQGVDADGKEWSIVMPAHYGYIRKTTASDRDHVDIFIGPNSDSDLVYVIDQVNPDTGDFDEIKVVLGTQSVDEARELYLSAYERGWRGLGNITSLTFDQFKQWLDEGDQHSPIAGQTVTLSPPEEEPVEQKPLRAPRLLIICRHRTVRLIPPAPRFLSFKMGLYKSAQANEGGLMAMIQGMLKRYATRVGAQPTAYADQLAIWHDIQNDALIHGVAANESEEFRRVLRGFWALTGMQNTATTERDFTAISDKVGQYLAPMLSQMMPNIWESIQGPVGSPMLLSSRIANAYKHAGLSPEYASELSRRILDHFYGSGDSRNAWYFTAGQIGELFEDMAQKGLLTLHRKGVDAEKLLNTQLSQLSNMAMQAAAVRDATTDAGQQPVGAYVDSVTRINSMMPTASPRELAQVIRELGFREQLQLEYAGGMGMEPSALPPEQVREMHNQLREQASKSELAKSYTIINNAVQRGYVDPQSEAGRLITQIRENGKGPPLTPSAAIDILTRSGMSRPAASALISTPANYTPAPWIVDVARNSQGDEIRAYAENYANSVIKSMRRLSNPAEQQAVYDSAFRSAIQQFGYSNPTQLTQLHPEHETQLSIISEARRRAAESMSKPGPVHQPLMRRFFGTVRKQPTSIREFVTGLIGGDTLEWKPEQQMAAPLRPFEPTTQTPMRATAPFISRSVAAPVKSDIPKPLIDAELLDPAESIVESLRQIFSKKSEISYTPVSAMLKTSTVPIIGIPDRSKFGDPVDFEPGELVDLFIQKHKSRRAGEHRDLRIGDLKRGLHSWAVRKAIPKPGDKPVQSWQTPIHTHQYGRWEGDISTGYGAGSVRLDREGKIVITRVSPNSIHFTTADTRHPERFVITKMKNGKSWLLMNTTLTANDMPSKPKLKTIPAERIDALIDKMQTGNTFEAKLDGAHSLVRLLKNNIEVTSYRKSTTGQPIVHTERIFGGRRPQIDIPKELEGTVLRGELYGQSDGVIPPQELSGLLNATIAKSLDTQKQKDVKLHAAIFDIAQRGKTPIDIDKISRSERRKMIQDVLQYLPKDTFHLTEEATTPEEAKELWSQIQSGQHPLTREGVVMWPEMGQASKAKLLDEADVYIRRIFEGEGRLRGRGAGGFEYSEKPDSEIIGRVGTGFDDALRKDMHKHPEAYIGHIARIKSQGRFPSGAYRAPVLISPHLDY